MLTWLLHWVSAILALFLLLTSLGSAFALLPRPFGSIWMELHLSTGTLLLIITALRIALGTVHGQFAILHGWITRSVALRNFLLILAFATAIVGLLLYQKPPLGKVSYFFVIVPMPTLIRLDHDWHNFAIGFHTGLACLLLVLIILHAAAGIKQKTVTGKVRLSEMIWPW